MNKGISQELYKYMSAEVCCKVLESGKLRFSSPLLFNDPFDVVRYPLGSLDFKRFSSEILKYLQTDYVEGKRDISELIEPLHKVVIEAQKKGIKLTDLLINEEKIIKQLCDNWENQIKKTRILCLSQIKDNIALWYHYADQYSGVVVSFDKLDEINGVANNSLRKINYKNELDGNSYKFWHDYFLIKESNILDNIFYEKYHCWNYEKEVRIVTRVENLNDDQLYSYFEIKKQIKSVYFGPKINDQKKNKLIALIRDKYPKVKIYQVKIRHVLEFDKL
ncbi:DUF2971 domain-containing protein [Orbus wheelerorum]|uniref:DUF2971 domain-containing protein n=1 Tax=Orbus wheelerorum TaxID=3074111 RepID=UPI00370D1C81